MVVEPALARGEGALSSPASARSTASSPTRTPAPRPTSSACRSPPPAPTPHRIDWAGLRPAAAELPRHPGVRRAGISPISRATSTGRPFFQTWELKGRYPKILEDAAQGAAARAALRGRAGHARRRSSPSAGSPRAPSSASGRPTRSATTSASSPTRAAATELATFFTLRQQRAKRLGQENVALADFVAPEGTPDYVGGFVVTAGIEEVAIAERFERANDDYSAILVKALADRFAEAFAERLHERVRREFWGYAPDEAFAPEELIGEPYRGIRPAPGYPAQPDHSEKATLFRLLDAERATGVTLTESFAMWPGSSVSGLYLAHPDSYYFGVAQVERDQVEDYARRKGDGGRRGRALAGADPQLRAGAGRLEAAEVRARRSADPHPGRVVPVQRLVRASAAARPPPRSLTPCGQSGGQIAT